MAEERKQDIGELERRKRVRIRLRPDLGFVEQRYEGRVYHVVKDPVSMRYYRFKEHERYLLGFMDGKHTLEEAQKAFETRFRPERLTLEDLEAFTSQLLQAGLAQNETPNAGKGLFDRYKKRQRRKFFQYILNILYIKIPLYDPDRVLTAMLPYTRWIFTKTFGLLSLMFMLSALFLVLANWNSFLSKLPAYHEFFTLKTVFYLWIALGAVKIIHEFGHGLSCKSFRGEVHEMGALFLVFSPCLYCNVSDSWTLPNKWHRIIISAAGIWVELVIAAAATWVWWWSEPGGFIYNISMALMVVCSVSTVIFNANPLMRFDGYYVMADWLEIPNLREKSNRFLLEIVQEHCLGIEVPPRPYMELDRKVLFVTYAIVSYLYRWFIMFSVLVFMYTFLEPYKLGAISFLLGTMAAGSMIGQPIYQLFKHVHRRGRLPDMKPLRVSISAAILAAVILAVLFVPLPMRVRALAIMQVDPAHTLKVETPEMGGFLKELLIVDGAVVKKGDVLARLENPNLEIDLKLNEKNQALRLDQVSALTADYVRGYADLRLTDDLNIAIAELHALQRFHTELQRVADALVIRAPRDGVVRHLIHRSEVGKYLERGKLICEIGDERELRAFLLLPSDKVSLIKEKDEAWVRVHGLAYNYYRAEVATISGTEAKAVPLALTNKVEGNIATQTDSETRLEVPQTQHYLVTLRFESSERDHLGAIHPGVMARVKIIAAPQTLWWRIHRYLARTFNLGL
jgi:putative peptide zinc metalloprotease protein